ncbi:hypothetical protein TraAM80_07474 [Trypanosoma rangeli]|uniref:JmjC domain-containing protein n=1 Tax=Trypanosoma rangeli TaxID=5698 RepID=A0A3R7LP24_TRYRA|nr:uncharacterized protein TraAM80_07474 [Trypanosoma rangeli]RNF00656.1 hypothetical protein TraAM80_07474 [Trypanosoma rangeli]|eukprot:RNF00656.1 hypothetical protein TraAM80_07474 [Trypanosoma rangeli]
MDGGSEQHGGTRILELDGATLTFDQFCECCLKPNFPAIIRRAVPECETDSTGCFCSSLERMRSRLAPKSLIDVYGEDHRVPTAETVTESPSNVDQTEYMLCRTRSLSEVMKCWRQNERVLYLKDWHMQLDSESRATTSDTSQLKMAGLNKEQRVMHGDGLYQVPAYLGDDWMDNFCRRSRADKVHYHHFGGADSDYRFAYIGPPSSWTPLHFDVFGTYSWSLNVCGEKLWYFPSPEGNQRLLENSFYGLMLPIDIRTTTDAELWAVLQRPGDLVFVPSGYLHQVHNVSGPRFPLPLKNAVRAENSVEFDTSESLDSTEADSVALVISINHNWCNEWCVTRMVEAFCRDANRIRQLLTEKDRILLFGDDLAAWHDHVEQLLIGGTNWNFACIRSFLKHGLASLSTHDSGCGAQERLRRILEKCLGDVNAIELRITHICRK